MNRQERMEIEKKFPTQYKCKECGRWINLGKEHNCNEEKDFCRICGGKILTYTIGGMYPFDDTREFHIKCINCGELDPTDLIDKCIICKKKLKKDEYLECKSCLEKKRENNG